MWTEGQLYEQIHIYATYKMFYQPDATFLFWFTDGKVRDKPVNVISV